MGGGYWDGDSCEQCPNGTTSDGTLVASGDANTCTDRVGYCTGMPDEDEDDDTSATYDCGTGKYALPALTESCTVEPGTDDEEAAEATTCELVAATSYGKTLAWYDDDMSQLGSCEKTAGSGNCVYAMDEAQCATPEEDKTSGAVATVTMTSVLFAAIAFVVA